MVKKQTFVIVTSFLAAVILIISIFAVKEKNKSDYYLDMIKNQYSEAFEQLNSSLNNISIATQKTIYVSSAKKMSSLAVEIFSEAELAKSALSKLPVGGESIPTVYRFLSQVGNYSLSVSKKITSENTVTEKQREELKLLSNTAKKITQIINNTGVEYNNANDWASEVENRLNNEVSEQGLASSLSEIEENLVDYPSLIYDGPYSDHILSKQPLMTSVAREYSQNEALSIAKGVSGSKKLKYVETQKGKIECYRFADNSVSITVSKNGGYTAYMRKSRVVNKDLITYEQAIKKGKDFLNMIKINNMQPTYYYTDNGVCVINFAYVVDDIICYTDLIKVGVAMDTGEIMLIEAVGYLTNHTARSFKTADYTVDQAAEKISSDLEIEKTGKALIPTDGGGEIVCYEFLCMTEDNQEILIYINAHTLEEEQIYILLKNDGGTLVK